MLSLAQFCSSVFRSLASDPRLSLPLSAVVVVFNSVPLRNKTQDNMASENTIIDMDYDYEEFNSSKRPKLISKVWEDMQRIQTSEGSKVQCGHCGKLLQDNCGTSHLKRHLDICPKRPRPPNNVAQESMSSAGILGTGNEKVLMIRPLKVEPDIPVTSSDTPSIRAPTSSASTIKIMRDLHQKTSSTGLLSTNETPRNQIDVTLDDAEMKAFYASLDAEASETKVLSPSQDTKITGELTNAVPREETKKSLRMLQEFLSKDFSSLLHPEQCSTMKTTLEQLSNLSTSDGISMEMWMLILEISRDFTQWSQDYNNANRKIESASTNLLKVDKLEEGLEANKNQFKEVVSLEIELSNQLTHLEERKKELEKQINTIKSNISSFQIGKNTATKRKRELFEEAKMLKAQRDELREQMPHVREESESAKKMQENIRAEWSKLGEKFDKSLGVVNGEYLDSKSCISTCLNRN